MQVPTSAANFVELEALRWENRKLSDAKAVAETEVQIVVHLAASCRLPARHLRPGLSSTTEHVLQALPWISAQRYQFQGCPAY